MPPSRRGVASLPSVELLLPEDFYFTNTYYSLDFSFIKCYNKFVSQQTGYVFFVRSFGCALFIYGGIQMSFSEKLTAARKAKKLTQQDLADRLNFNRSSIAKYETSSSVPPVKTILKLCDILEISFEELFR